MGLISNAFPFYEMASDMAMPVFALVFLTFIVWIRMYYVRFSEIKKSSLSIKDLRPDNIRNIPPRFVFSGDNFRNLCELPILFYVAALLIIVFSLADTAFIALAWVFVISRYIHSFIHTTYNNVKHRFLVYVFGAIVLWIIWIKLFWIIVTS